jgi:hypothetical protein
MGQKSKVSGEGQGSFGVFVSSLLPGMVGAGMACARLQA